MFILFPYFCTSCLMRFLVSPAEPPTTDVSTKRTKLAKAEEEKAETTEEERSQKEKVWPEPAERLRPPVGSASALPDDAACPDGLKCLTSSKDLGPLLVSRIKWEAVRVTTPCFTSVFHLASLTEPFPWRNRSTEVAGDADGVATFSRLYTLIEKMRTNEVKSGPCLVSFSFYWLVVCWFYLNGSQIGNGVALVPDVAAAVKCVVQDLGSDLVNRYRSQILRRLCFVFWQKPHRTT